jgi:acetoin utilization protein AcuB
MLVGLRMTRNVITATPQTSHREAVEMMRDNKIRRLPVVENDQLVGIVVQKDLLSVQPSPATTLSIYEMYTLLDRLKLEDIMKRPVITVGPDCPLEDAARIMIENRIGCLPVIRTGQLVGIITETDIFRMLVEVLGGGEEGIHFTVNITDQPGKLAELAGAVARAGGNIVSVTSFHGEDANHMFISLKEQGADQHKLRQNLTEIGVEIVDIQTGYAYKPVLVGA